MDDGDLRSTVLKQIVVVLCLHPGVGRNGHGADFDGAKEAEGEFGRVGQDQQNALFDVRAQLFQDISGLIDLLVNVLVSKCLVLIIDGDFFAPTLSDVLVHKSGRGIVDVRQIKFHADGS